MKSMLLTASFVIATGLALSAATLPANAASNCSTMFVKAEKMVAEKGNLDVAKKVKGYQMAIDGFQTCSKALAMANGAERNTMMKTAEGQFESAYSYIRNIE
jgi:hypothetical protein